VLNYQRDLAADFRVFYRLTPQEAMALPSPEYLALAYRVSAYQGVMALRLAEGEAKERRARPRRGARRVAGEREAIQADSLLGSAISFG
jgi:hypothetical protein